MTDDEHKRALRRAALEARRAVVDVSRLAAAIAVRVSALPAFAAARTVCWYVGVRDEVPTLTMIEEALAAGKVAVVPFRSGDRLELYRIASAEELEETSFGLLEPSAQVRGDRQRLVKVGDVDLFVVPGLAFDRSGGRIGYGRGYYDRLLARARDGAVTVGLAFEAQMVERVPTEPHDVPMSCVVTESGVYPPAARRSAGSGSRSTSR